MSNVEVIQHTPREVAPSSVLTPIEMLGNAIERGADPALLEKLMVLSERWEASQARKAFNIAMADAKAEIGTVKKEAKGNYGNYADLASVTETVNPALHKHGFRIHNRIEQTERTVTVICEVSHRDGHTEETAITSPIDLSGSKTAVQQIGSTVTYLQRYTLMAALGLAASKDDDGQGTTKTSETLSVEQAEKIKEALRFIDGNVAKFCEFMRVKTLEEIPARDFDKAMNAIRGAK